MSLMDRPYTTYYWSSIVSLAAVCYSIFSNNSSPENYSSLINSNLSVTRQKTNSSNLNPATMKITTIHSPWMNSLMLYLNLMIQLLARMMSTTKCLNTTLMMLCSLYSTFLITSGLRENSLQAGVLLQLYQFLNLVKIHLTFLTIAQLLSQVAFARSWSA